MRAPLVLLLALAACEPGRIAGRDGGRPPVDAGRDAALDAWVAPDAPRRRTDAGVRPADPPGDDTHWFVISLASIGVEEPADSGVAPGFDLDGLVTAGRGDPTGCGQADFVAPSDQGGGDGIDNQVAPLYAQVLALSPETDFDADLENAISNGQAILLVRMAHVGSLVDDGAIEVAIVSGLLADAGAPRAVTVTREGVMHRALAPDQRFRVDPASLLGGRPRIVFDDAYIVGGRLLTGGTTFSLRVPATSGRELVIDLRDVHVDARLTADGFERGVLGGYALQEDLARGVASALRPDDPVSPETVALVLSTYADVDLDLDGECEGVSAVLRLDVVPAVVLDPP